MVEFVRDIGVRPYGNSPSTRRNRRFCVALCHCGKHFEARTDQIKNLKSCGCSRNEVRNDVPIGEIYGRLTIVADHGIQEYGGERTRMVGVRCICSEIVHTRSLKSIQKGQTLSCGCLRVDTMSEIGRQNLTHGQDGTKLYKIWTSMKGRCSTPSITGYERYGGRGIKVCEEWQSYEPFYNWAMANGYEEGLTIDRKNNDGDYTPSNCQWLTRADNTRKMHEDKRRKNCNE